MIMRRGVNGSVFGAAGAAGIGRGVGDWLDYNPAHAIVDPAICWLFPDSERCKPIPTMQQIIDGPAVDCSQSGWAGNPAACALANAQSRDTMRDIAARESVTNPDAYREWYEVSGNPADMPAPVTDWSKWLLIAGLAIGGLVLLSALTNRR